MQIPGGMLADRFKPRVVIAAATLGWGLFQAVAAVSFSAWVLVLTRLGLGASEAPIYPAGGKLNAIWMTSNERARGRDVARRRRPARRGARLPHHRGPDRRIRLLAHFLRRCRRRHHALRAARLVVHPRQSRGPSLGQQGRGRPHRQCSRPRRLRLPLRRPELEFGPISATVPPGACASGGCSSTPSGMAS